MQLRLNRMSFCHQRPHLLKTRIQNHRSTRSIKSNLPASLHLKTKDARGRSVTSHRRPSHSPKLRNHILRDRRPEINSFYGSIRNSSGDCGARSPRTWQLALQVVLWCSVMKMSRSVTVRAQRDEILFGVIPQAAARAEVVDLKILRCAAILAAPPIAREHLAGELAIRVGFKAQSRPFRFESVQGSFLTISSNCSLCATGRVPISRASAKNNVLSAPASRLAPARKSAQIISRQ